jgi:hypothetical protein
MSPKESNRLMGVMIVTCDAGKCCVEVLDQCVKDCCGQ